MVSEDWATGLSVCCLILELSHTVLTKLKAGHGTTFWKETIKCCLCMPDFKHHHSGSFCQAHCRIITLISTCQFRGWRNIFTPYMRHTYPNSFQVWLWQISSQQLASQQLKKRAARAATDDSPTPHSGGRLLCADDLNKWVSWWEWF